jgi:hypothetical protein
MLLDVIPYRWLAASRARNGCALPGRRSILTRIPCRLPQEIFHAFAQTFFHWPQVGLGGSVE